MNSQAAEFEYYQGVVLKVLSRHIGRAKAINMAALHQEVFGEQPRSTISGTRRLRRVVERLRRQGVPICASAGMVGGGYFLPAAGQEMEDYCRRLRLSALKKLRQEAGLRKLALPDLLGQIALNLEA
jgi:hypothetical protein